MFESEGFGQSLEESQFELWLEQGREHRFGYHYLVVLWDYQDESFKPLYLEDVSDVRNYNPDVNREVVVAAYDVYSESKVGME